MKNVIIKIIAKEDEGFLEFVLPGDEVVHMIESIQSIFDKTLIRQILMPALIDLAIGKGGHVKNTKIGSRCCGNVSVQVFLQGEPFFSFESFITESPDTPQIRKKALRHRNKFFRRTLVPTNYDLWAVNDRQVTGSIRWGQLPLPEIGEQTPS